MFLKKTTQGAHWIVSLVDPQDENELGEEEGGGAVVHDAGFVALHGSQTQEEDGGEEEEAKGDSNGAPREDFNGQDLTVLIKITCRHFFFKF